VFKCLCFAGELYQNIAGCENALECYTNALEKNTKNKNKQIQKQIGIIEKAIRGKSNEKHSKKKKNKINFLFIE
jgi:2-oxoglutarate dehydrogenase complex dehydrogenase (E1) component-like enzyme